MSELLTVEEAAELLRMSRDAFYQLRHRGGGPRGLKVGRRLLFKREDVLRWAEEQIEPRRRAAAGAGR